MKRCAKCSKTYDDSWKVCLNCGTVLEASASAGAAAGSVAETLARFDERIRRLEAYAGVAPQPALEIPAEAPAETFKSFQAKEAFTPAVKQQPSPKKPSTDLESTIGLVWLNRIGVLALLLGAAFFLKYAFDNRWIGELGRVALGLAAGAGCLGAAEVLRRKGDDVVSQGLHGVGTGVLYLSIYAAFAFYKLIGVFPALLFMTAVTAYGYFWSVRANWMSAAIIGTAGGFLTVYLIGMRHMSPALLFPYVAVLNLGVLAVSLVRPWRALNLLSFFLTHLVFVYWLQKAGTSHWVEGSLYAALFFAVFSVLSVAHNLARKAASDSVDVLLILINGIVFFSEIHYLCRAHASGFPALLPLGLAVLYLGYAWNAIRRIAGDRQLIMSYAGMTVIFVTVAFPVQFGSKWAVLGWTGESAVLFWIGSRTALAPLRRYGMIVGVLAVLMLVAGDPVLQSSPFNAADRRFLLNEDALLYFAAAAAALGVAGLYRRHREGLPSAETGVGTILIILANVLMVYRLSAECQVYFAHAAKAALLDSGVPAAQVNWSNFIREYNRLFSPRQLSISIVWIVYALGAILAGMAWRFKALRVFALVLFGLAVFKIFLVDLSRLERFYRILSFLGLGVVLMAVSFVYQRYKERIHEFALKD